MTERGTKVSVKREIEIEFDEETQTYYIIWEPTIISSGRTEREALEDLRGAGHCGVDTIIDSKLRATSAHVPRRSGCLERRMGKRLCSFRGGFAFALSFK